MQSLTKGSDFIIKVFLYSIKPEIWRRFSISKDVSFQALSDAIQAAMGWDGRHPHEFRHGKGKRLVDVIGPVGLEDMCIGDFKNELEITLAQFVGKRALPVRFLYRYDFADEWIHEVVIESRTNAEKSPMMIDGARACPPEDFGGVFQYMQALNVEIPWDLPTYDPEYFALNDISFEKKKARKSSQS